MKLFHKVGRCFGVVLWLRPHTELWICFKGLSAHRHPEQHVEVIPLWGWATFYRCSTYVEKVAIRPQCWGRAFSIPTGWLHWFELKFGPLIFVNVTDDGRSAADNVKD